MAYGQLAADLFHLDQPGHNQIGTLPKAEPPAVASGLIRADDRSVEDGVKRIVEVALEGGRHLGSAPCFAIHETAVSVLLILPQSWRSSACRTSMLMDWKGLDITDEVHLRHAWLENDSRPVSAPD